MCRYKVVYNAAISGGLYLSEKALNWLKKKGMKSKAEELEQAGPFVEIIPRHNSILVECIETLGEEANGPEDSWKSKAELHVATITGKYYYIDDHDGAGEEVIDISKMIDASEQ